MANNMAQSPCPPNEKMTNTQSEKTEGADAVVRCYHCGQVSVIDIPPSVPASLQTEPEQNAPMERVVSASHGEAATHNDTDQLTNLETNNSGSAAISNNNILSPATTSDQHNIPSKLTSHNNKTSEGDSHSDKNSKPKPKKKEKNNDYIRRDRENSEKIMVSNDCSTFTVLSRSIA